MSLSSNLQILQAAPVFSQMPDDALRLLAFGVETRTYYADQIVYHAGDYGNCAFVITEGQVEILKLNKAGELQPVMVAQQASLLGELALVSRTQRQFTAKAIEKTQMLKIDRPLFEKLMGEYPDIAKILQTRIQQNLADLLDGLDKVGRKLDLI